jgi:Ca-activated chloride channel family protein
MSLLSPLFLWLIVPLLFLYIYFGDRVENLKRFRLYLVMMLFVVVALARPAFVETLDDEEVLGVDIVVALDLSYSMQATDIAPTRFSVAKESLNYLFQHSRADRFALIGFTTNAIILSPLTRDHRLLQQALESIEPRHIVTKGTQLLPVIALSKKIASSDQVALVIISDGGDQTQWSSVINEANRLGVSVSVLGVATEQGTTLQNDQGSGVLRNAYGKIVVTSLNKSVEQLASFTQGHFAIFHDYTSLFHLYEMVKEGLEVKVSQQKTVHHTELFWLPLLVAFLLFFALETTLAKRWLVVVLLAPWSERLEAGMLDFYYIKKAKIAYEKNDFKTAVNAYKAMGDKNQETLMNLANSYYYAGELEKAVATLKRIKTSDHQRKAALFYNIGTIQIHLGIYASAKTNLLKSWTLVQDNQTMQNLRYVNERILQEPPSQLQSRKQGKEEEAASQEASNKQSKQSGTLNMQVSTASSGGGGKTTEQEESKLQVNQKPRPTSSHLYELINQRSVHEEKPW